MANHAICIGINQYEQEKRWESLSWAMNDAREMSDLLVKQEKFDNVFYFADDAEPISILGRTYRAKPTHSNLIHFFAEFFEDVQFGDRDNIWFFFSGHGVVYNGDDYLMPCDGSLRAIDETAISVRKITQYLRKSGVENIILFLDACRNVVSQGKKGYFGQDKIKGIVTFYSCQPGQIAYEIDKLQRGSFTYALLESLQIPGSECATVERLDNRLRDRVKALNQEFQKEEQNPYTAVEPIQMYHDILLPQKASDRDILALINDALGAEIEKNYRLARRLWIRVLEVSPRNSIHIGGGVRAIERIAIAQISESVYPQRKAIDETGRKSAIKPVSPSFSFEVVTVNAKGEEIKRERRSANYQREDLGNGVNLDMVEIPGGTFMMGTEEAEIERLCKKYGSDWFKRESPQHEVTVKSFLMGKTPITQAQWREVVNRVETIERELNPDPSYFKGDKRPVEMVSWYDAVEFCVRLSKLTGQEYRLPSEAEWEYGCRGGMKTPFHFGETITADLANYNGNKTFANEPKGKYRKETTPVDEFAHPNAFGLYDMHGNVWEWCLDPWHSNYEGAPTDGRVWDENDNDYQNLKELLRYETNACCLRGGSWYDPDNCRSSNRDNDTRDVDNHVIGFRVVSSPVAEV